MRLKARQRKALPSKDFAVPSKAPGSGSYPIPDRAHAADAKARASGKPVEAQVDRAVARKFPGMGKGKKGKGGSEHPQSHAAFERLGREDHGKY